MRISDWSSDVCSSDLLEASAVETVFPVNDADGAVMPFHYGARDGETAAAVLAEFLIIRPDAVETATDRLALGFGDAGNFILNADDQLLVTARGHELDPTAGGDDVNGGTTKNFY